MRLILFLVSLVIAVVLLALAYTKYESLVVYSYVILFVLAILNLLANFLQVIDYFRSAFEPDDLKVQRGRDIFTPLYLNTEAIVQHLDKSEPAEIDVAVWHEKAREYLFLTAKRGTRNRVSKFVCIIEDYNELSRKLKALIRSLISSQIYEHSEGIVIPPSDPDGYGFNATFNDFCQKKAEDVVDQVFQILLQKNASSLTPSERHVIERPLIEILSEGNSFAFYVRSEDPEEIGEKLAKYTNEFSEGVFTQLYGKSILRAIKEKRTALIREAKELHKILGSEIEESA
jgi:hypothetical protein